MTERDLELRVTAESAQARAELGEVAAAEAALGTEAGQAAAVAERAAEQQQAAVLGISAALESAMTAMGTFASSAEAGGKVAEQAFLRARNATAQLEVAIGSAKAIGAPVSGEAIAILQAYDAVLMETVVAQDLAAASGKKTSVSFGQLRAEGILASQAVGPLGRGLAALAGSGDGAVASLSRLLLPIAAAAGAALVLNKTFEALNARGLDMGSAATIAGAAMDSLAVALGGTTKATAEAIDAYEKAQKSVEGLDNSTRAFKTGLDLVASSGLDVKVVLQDVASAVSVSIPEWQQFSEGAAGAAATTDNAKTALNRLNLEINAVRLTSPQLAAQMVNDFVRLEKAVQDGTAGAGKALADFLTKQHSASAGSVEFIKTVEEMYGKDGPKAFGTFSAATVDVVQKFDKLRVGGLTADAAFEKLKGQFETSAAGARVFAAAIQSLPDGPLKTAAERVLALENAIGGLNPALDKQKKAIDDAAKAWVQINGAVDSGTAILGTHHAAVVAILPELNREIDTLEKQRDGHGKLNPLIEATVQSLKKLRDETGVTGTATEKLTDSEEKHARQLRDLSVEIEKNANAYKTKTNEVEKSRKVAVEAAQSESDAVTNSVQTQIAALDRKRRDGTLSETEFRNDVAKLQGDEVNTRRKAQADVDKINADAATSQDDLKLKFDESTTKIVEKIGDLRTSYDELTAARISVDTSAKDQVKTLELESLAHATVATKVGTSRDVQKDLAGAIKQTNVDLNAHLPGLDNLHKTHTEKLHVSIPKTSGALSDLGVQLGSLSAQDIPTTIAGLNDLTVATNAAAQAFKDATAAAAAFAGDQAGGTGDSGGASAA